MARSDINIRIGAKLDGLQRELSKAQRRLTRFASFAEGVGTSLTTRLTLPIVGAGAAAVSTFAKFDRIEKGLQVFAGSAEAAGAQFDRLNAIVNDTRTTLDLETAAKGVQRLQTMGLSAADAENAIKQFGISATNSGDSVQEVGLALRQFGQILAKGKAEQEDFNSLFDNLGGLSRVVLEEFGVKTADQLRATGISMEDFILRTVKAIETNDQLQSVQGGLAKSFESFGNAVQVALRPVGESIARALNLEENLQKLSDTITELGQKFANLSPGVQRFIVGTAAAAAALGPLLLGVGTLVRVAAEASIGLRLLSGTINRSVTASFTALFSPLGLAVAAFAALAAGLVIAYRRSETFRGVVSQLVDNLKNTFVPIGRAMIELVEGIGDRIFGTGQNFKFFLATVSGVMTAALSAVNVFFEGLADGVEGIGLLLEREFKAAFSKIGDALKKTNPVGIAFSEGKNIGDAYRRGYEESLALSNGAKPGATGFSFGDTEPDFNLNSIITSQTPAGGDGANLDRLKAERAELQFNTKKLGEIITLERELDLIRKGSLGNYIEPVRQVNSLTTESATATALLSDALGDTAQRIKQNVSPAVRGLSNDLRSALVEIRDGFAQSFGSGLADIITNIFSAVDTQKIADLNRQLEEQRNILAGIGEEELSKEEKDAKARQAAEARIELIQQEIELEKKRGNVLLQTGKLAIDVAKQAIQAALAKAIAEAIAANAKFGLPGLALAGAAVAGISALFNSKVPKLAAGGIIPPGFEGDRFPAMLNSGEAVIPLQKLFNFLGDQQGRGEFILRGQDLYLAMNRAERAYNRTGG